MNWRQRSREDSTLLSDLGQAGAGLPAVTSPGALEQVGEFLIRGVTAIFTPMRAFATRKALLFASLTVALMAGKLSVTYAGASMIGRVALTDPTIGQAIVLALTVVALGWINLKAFQTVSRAKEKANQVLLDLMRNPRVPTKVKLQLLDRLKD